MTTTKSFEIARQVVWGAHERVKSNNCAAGVDGESKAQFEKHLKKNLYKSLEPAVVRVPLRQNR